MGRVKFGNGIRLEAQLPKVEQSSPKVEQSINLQELAEKVLAMLPTTETPKEVITPTKEVDLSHLATLDDVKRALECGANLENKVNSLTKEMDLIHSKLEDMNIVIPEVKQVTHVQDVSPEVLKKCKEMLRYSEEAMMLKVNSLQKRVNTQEKMNYVLGGILILTILLHLM